MSRQHDLPDDKIADSDEEVFSETKSIEIDNQGTCQNTADVKQKQVNGQSENVILNTDVALPSELKEINSELKKIVETLLLVADAPLSAAKIRSLFADEGQPELEHITHVIESIQQDCEQRGVELVKIGKGYRFQSKIKYAPWIRKLFETKPPKMSRALLETLAIIAYKQPVTRGDIEEVRGVSVSADMMHRLLEREWVKQIGVRDVPGRPALFGTTPEFLSHFGLSSLKDLPSLVDERPVIEVSQDMDEPMPDDLLQQLMREEGVDLHDETILPEAEHSNVEIQLDSEQIHMTEKSDELDESEQSEEINHNS